MKYSIYILLLICSISCKKSVNDDQTIKKFTREDFRKSSSLFADTIAFDKPLDPMYFYVICDTLLVVENKGKTNNLIDLYGLASKELIISICNKGRGPKEFLSASFKYNHNSDFFWVHDVTMKTYNRFNIDSLLKLKEKYQFVRYKVPPKAIEIYEYDRNSFICYNRWYIDKIDQNKDENELFIFDKAAEDTQTYKNDNKLYPANVNGGYILTSKSKNRIVVAHKHDDLITIYNSNLQIIGKLKGPDNFKPEYSQMGDMLVFKDGLHLTSYYPCFSTKHAIYMIYLGEEVDPRGTNWITPVEVFKISWDGELLHRYILDTFLYTITIDSKGNYLYGSTLESMKSYPKLVRFKLK